MISVIVPVYNAEKYINRCIDSIVHQTMDDMEIIIIDDGSTDSSLDICKYWETKDRRIKVFPKKNGGVSSARNMGLRNVNGKYVSFVDADDWIESDRFEKAIEKIEEYNADIYIGSFVINVGNEQKTIYEDIPSVVSVYGKNDAIKHMIKGNGFRWELCDKVYRKDVLEGCYLDENIHNGEDFLFNWCVFGKAKRIIRVNDMSYHYFAREDSASHVLSEKYLTFVDAIELALGEEQNRELCLLLNNLYIVVLIGMFIEIAASKWGNRGEILVGLKNKIQSSMLYGKEISFKKKLIVHFYKISPISLLIILNPLAIAIKRRLRV